MHVRVQSHANMRACVCSSTSERRVASEARASTLNRKLGCTRRILFPIKRCGGLETATVCSSFYPLFLFVAALFMLLSFWAAAGDNINALALLHDTPSDVSIVAAAPGGSIGIGGSSECSSAAGETVAAAVVGFAAAGCCCGVYRDLSVVL